MVIGYDPEAIDALIARIREERRNDAAIAAGAPPSRPATAPISPPGTSLAADQHGRVADDGTSLADGLRLLLERIRAELDWNDARGGAPYRLGMHDGLRFAEDAVSNLLRLHGHEVDPPGERDVDA